MISNRTSQSSGMWINGLQAKRLMDIVGAAAGLVLLAPLLLILACAVRLTSKGPVIYRQERVGVGGQTFQLLKFRSMRADLGGPSLTVADDERVTPLGRILRHYKLDELPQLMNVLKGDMSLVGPRPEVPRYVELYCTEYEEILTVRPGLTDYASITFRHESELFIRIDNVESVYVEEILPRKLELAKHYIQTRSFLGDIQIILSTLSPSWNPKTIRLDDM